MYLALIAAVVRVCLDLHLWLMGLEVSLRDRARGAAFIGALWGNITSVALRWFHRLLFIGAWAVPLGATAWAWGQERIPGARHELGATALTANQILTAKALVWLVPLALYGALRVTGTVASDLIVVTATPPDSLAARFAEEIYTEIWDPGWLVAWLSVDYLKRLLLAPSMGAVLIGLLSLIALRGGRPVIGFAALASTGVAWMLFVEPWGDRLFYRIASVAGVLVHGFYCHRFFAEMFSTLELLGSAIIALFVWY